MEQTYQQSVCFLYAITLEAIYIGEYNDFDLEKFLGNYAGAFCE